MANQQRHGTVRPAFTLIELLVVISIIGILSGLIIAFIPSFNTKSRAARGGQNLQVWLNIARQKAIRDQAPRGLRISFDAAGVATRCQFIEQPDDLGGGRVFVGGATQFTTLQLDKDLDAASRKDANNNPIPKEQLVVVTGADFVDESVQIGDYLEVNGANLPHFIVGIDFTQPPTYPAPKKKNLLILASRLPAEISTPITNFRIIRRPRLTGDEVMDLPETVIVDANTNLNYASTVPGIDPLVPSGAAADYDVLFSPTGAVMPQSGQTKPYIVFWVRSTDEDTAFPPPAGYFRNEPTLIVVYINSGMVAAYAVDSSNLANPYGLVRP